MKTPFSRLPFRRRVSAPAATLALALGILIWMKLRLVTGLPRSVYAEPERPLTPPAPATTPDRPLSVDTADRTWRTPPVEDPAPGAPRDAAPR